MALSHHTVDVACGTNGADGGICRAHNGIAETRTSTCASATWIVKRQPLPFAPEVVAPKVPEMLELLLGELPGRVWEGKDAVPKATADVAEACPEATAAVPGGGARVIAALVTEAARKKIQQLIRTHLSCLPSPVPPHATVSTCDSASGCGER